MVSRKHALFSRLLLVLTLVLGWQLSSSFTTDHGFAGRDLVSAYTRPLVFTDTHPQLDDWFPPMEVRQALEAEPVIEEDDDLHEDTSPIDKPAMTRPVPDEYRNALSVKNRLAQLAAQALKRPPLDFFLLFHSWKTDPC